MATHTDLIAEVRKQRSQSIEHLPILSAQQVDSIRKGHSTRIAELAAITLIPQLADPVAFAGHDTTAEIYFVFGRDADDRVYASKRVSGGFYQSNPSQDIRVEGELAAIKIQPAILYEGLTLANRD